MRPGLNEADGTVRGQVLNESLGLPSSARSPMRFTASLRKDETAKTVRPTGVPEKGPAMVRAREVFIKSSEE